METALYSFAFVVLFATNLILWYRYSARINQLWEQLGKEQRRAEEAEKKAMEQIRLLSVISHELKTPLQTVVASVDLLLLRSHSDDEEKVISRLRKASEQIEAQIADMSTYSHILSGMLVLSPEPFNPQEELKMLVEEFKGGGEKKGLSFTYDFPDPEKTVVSDVRRFRQIATNLISNTVKYASPGPVTISLTYLPARARETAQMAMIVEDSGPGISAELLPNIFNEFSQGKHTHSQTQGIGMGLAITARLVSLMGGTINVSSSQGKGARFTVRLPITDSDSNPSAKNNPDGFNALNSR